MSIRCERLIERELPYLARDVVSSLLLMEIATLDARTNLRRELWKQEIPFESNSEPDTSKMAIIFAV